MEAVKQVRINKQLKGVWPVFTSGQSWSDTIQVMQHQHHLSKMGFIFYSLTPFPG